MITSFLQDHPSVCVDWGNFAAGTTYASCHDVFEGDYLGQLCYIQHATAVVTALKVMGSQARGWNAAGNQASTREHLDTELGRTFA